MKQRSLFISLTFLIAFFCLAQARAYAWESTQANEKEVAPPRKLEYDNKLFRTLPVWQDSSIYIESDLDNDTGNEVIIGFIATYKPESEDEEEEKVQFAPPKKREIIPVENHAFYQIYKRSLDGRFHVVKTISGMDRLGKIEVFDIDAQNHKALAIFSLGGEHYTDLSIYRWLDGGYKLIFNEGSSKAITMDTKQKPVRVLVGASGDKQKIYDIM